MENLKKEILEWKKTDNYLKEEKKENADFETLKLFLKRFSIENIKQMEFDDYVSGNGNQNSFCNIVENRLSSFGEIGGKPANYNMFTLVWSEDKKDYIFGGENTKQRTGFGNNKEEIFQNIKKYLINLINDTRNNDYEEIWKNKLSPSFKNKISFLYSNNNQLPVYSESVVDSLIDNLNIKYIDILDIKYDDKKNKLKKQNKFYKSVEFKRKKLWDFYSENFKDVISPALFIYFLIKIKKFDKKKEEKNRINYEQEKVENKFKDLNNLNTIFYGVPGTGKTFEAIELAKKITNKNLKNIKFVTFHQSYEYEDFVEGIKVKTTKDNNIEYYIRDGIFKDLCKTASKNKNEKFVIIIDEINRGNISKIFGELITLIEPSKRENSKFEIKTILPYSREEFSVPSNLYIIGTMNTADRSITHIDSALRRRFKFIEKLPDYNLFENEPIIKDSNNIDISKLLRAINERIEIKYDKDHIIGHSYFLDCINIDDKNILEENEKYENLKSIFKQDIIPMLQEYFFDDYNTIRFILNDNDTSSEYNFLKKKNYFEKDSKTYSEKELYEINNDAFKYPESFIKIYENKKDDNVNDLTENKENESN